MGYNMNKIVLLILLTTSPLFSMQRLVRRLVSQGAQPKKSISLQNRNISTAKVQEILNPVKEISSLSKDTLKNMLTRELAHNIHTLELIERGTYGHLYKEIWHLNSPLQCANETINQIYIDLHNQIIKEWKEKEQKYNQSVSEEQNKSQASIVIQCFRKTHDELHTMLLQDQDYQQYKKYQRTLEEKELEKIYAAQREDRKKFVNWWQTAT